MAPLQSRGAKPVVLLTNDDGPPSASSPNIFGFAKRIQEVLGWEVRVVVPDCQKSWVGKAYAISDIIHASYFYPLEPDGLKGEVTPFRRPLKDGETMEWVLLSGTPATCSNIALHNLYPGEIDIVISGPNHGRNSSTAFSLSSGTIGAALGAALSVGMADPSPSSSSLTASGPSTAAAQRPFIPALAVSYGLVERPCPAGAIEAAQEVAVDIVKQLWDDWGYECTTPCAYGPGGSGSGSGSGDGVATAMATAVPARNEGKEQVEKHRTQLYTINVPLVPKALEQGRRRAVWANMWRSAYGSLFKQTFTETGDFEVGSSAAANRPQYSSGNIHDINASSTGATSSPSEPEPDSATLPSSSSSTKEAGPGALPTPAPTPVQNRAQQPQQQPLRFKFAPGMKSLLDPPIDSLPYGSDAWAFAQGWSTVVPLRAEFGGITTGRESWFERDGGERIVPGDTF